ncbi:MAG: DNA/RNA-binding protein AlbA [Desulfurococcales archaeon]|nr:DNA/RNA-binding protein AlbA [Desulfurococcales archaeon]MEB3759434.1 DNA/RNA-binding protein AlbA [Desulfurococcales archaeon]MEB3766078.1 DNA/RNA-binding protein AlbA [Desulfurococcales archaeon]MEB3789356.1 DNA/RNA-binding protein AlbA [Desulfurococcales archaeon]
MACEGAPEVRIGKKSIQSYVLAILMNLVDQGANQVVVKARGRNINKAVDAVEIVRNRFAKGVNIVVESCEIGSQEIPITDPQTGQTRTRRVSSIEICLKKEAA